MTQVGLLLLGPSSNWECTSSRDLFTSLNLEIPTSEHSGTRNKNYTQFAELEIRECLRRCGMMYLQRMRQHLARSRPTSPRHSTAAEPVAMTTVTTTTRASVTSHRSSTVGGVDVTSSTERSTTEPSVHRVTDEPTDSVDVMETDDEQCVCDYEYDTSTQPRLTNHVERSSSSLYISESPRLQ